MHDSFEDDQANTLLRFKVKVKIDFELLYSLYKEFILVGYSECSWIWFWDMDDERVLLAIFEFYMRDRYCAHSDDFQEATNRDSCRCEAQSYIYIRRQQACTSSCKKSNLSQPRLPNRYKHLACGFLPFSKKKKKNNNNNKRKLSLLQFCIYLF